LLSGDSVPGKKIVEHAASLAEFPKLPGRVELNYVIVKMD